MINVRADIYTRKIEKTFMYNGSQMLKIDIEYPNVKLSHGGVVQSRINIDFNNIARSFYSYAVKTLLPNAIEHYKSAVINEFPFNPYDADMKYTLTQNDNCTLSVFFDKYEYTGGAHGQTVRISDNRSLQTGNIIKLSDIFKNSPGYIKLILRRIIKQADKNIEDMPGIYFDDYKKLIVENFNPQSFNITPDSLDFYYQQYDIAPYASGIIVFSIPYEDLGIPKPHCK